MEAASGAVRGVLEQLPGHRRRRRRLPIAVAGLVVGAFAAIGVATWWIRRRTASTARPDVVVLDRELNQDALDRAANEGMPAITDKDDLAPSNGEVRDLAGVGDLASL